MSARSGAAADDLELIGLTRTFREMARPAVGELSLAVPRGELVALLGPSGCGKTTALRMIAGLLEPDSGRILMEGRDVTRLPAEKRPAVMVFQNHLLFPFLNAVDNIAFGLRMQHLSRAAIAERVEPIVARMQLSGLENRRAHELSAGQRQRVALARALVLRPRILLLDEPLANLDAELREEMRALILSIREEFQLTVVLVTHDQEEAALLGDRVAVMFDGRLHQLSTARELYLRPRTAAIARFLGNTNLLRATFDGRRLSTPYGSFAPPEGAPPIARGADCCLLVLPDGARIVPGGPAGAPDDGCLHVPATIERASFLGTHLRYEVRVDGARWVLEEERRASTIEPGARVTLSISVDGLWPLAAEDG